MAYLDEFFDLPARKVHNSYLAALVAGDVSHGVVRPDQYFLWEYEEGDFYRVFQIHESIDSARIEAECQNGVLTVHLPKAESAKPKQVTVKATA